MLNIFHGIHQGPLPALTSEEVELAVNLRRHVQTLSTEIGVRNILTRPKEFELAPAYIESVFTKLGYKTDSQYYSLRSDRYALPLTEVRNLEAELVGSGKPTEIIVLGAHYDSVRD